MTDHTADSVHETARRHDSAAALNVPGAQSTTIEISLAGPSDRMAVESLLAANGLPIEGLDKAFEYALVARESDRVVGSAAIERYGSAGLLRSVCVEAGVRGTGLGHDLVARAEDMARAAGVEELFLLTETAVEWFPRLGYLPAELGSVPDPMLVSPEFTGACPKTARLLHKRLDRTSARP